MLQAVQGWWASHAPSDVIWLIVGLTGQAMFSARWILQWAASERSQRSEMPECFWYLSMLGGLLVLSYGIHKGDPVIVLGQFGVLIYARNLFFISAKKTKEAMSSGTAVTSA